MYVVKVLKRKDASSVVVAVWFAFQLVQLTSMVSQRAINWLSGLGDSSYSASYMTGGWRAEYWNPVASLLVQLVVLEVVIRLFVVLHPMLVKKSK